MKRATKKDSVLRARHLADDVARAMRFYPMALRTIPPRLIDIDDAFSKIPFMKIFRVLATNPRDEGGLQSGPSDRV